MMQKILLGVALVIIASVSVSCAADATGNTNITIQKHLVVICPDNSVEVILQEESEYNKLRSILEDVRPSEQRDLSFKQSVTSACKK